MVADIAVRNEGSLVLLIPTSEAGGDWLDEHIGPDNGYQPWWPNVIVEPRYLSDILEGIAGDGLIFGAS